MNWGGVTGGTRLGPPSLLCRRFEVALPSDTLSREPIIKLAFPLWRAIGWCNTMTTETRRQAAGCVHTESFELGPLITPLVLKKMTAASPDQRAI